MAKKPLSKTLKRFFCVEQLGHQMVGQFHSYLGTYALTDVVGLPLAMVAIVTGIASAVQMIFTPFVGVIMDKTKYGRFGKNRKWLVYVPILWMLTLWAGFVYFYNDVVSTIVLTVIWSITNCIGIFLYTVPISMIGVLASDSEERAMLSGRRSMWTYAGKLLYSAVSVTILAHVTALVGSTKISYPLLITIYALIAVILYLVEFRMTAGYEEEGQAATTVHEKGPSLKEILKNVFSNAQLGVQTVCYISVTLSLMQTTSMLVYYYNYVAENNSLFTINMILNSIVGLLAGTLLPVLAKKLSNKTIALLAYGVTAIGLVIAWVFGIYQPILFMVGAGLMNFGNAMSQAVGIALFGDCAIYSEWKTGISSRNTIMGLNSVAVSIGVLISRIAVPMILAQSGYVAGAAITDSVKKNIVTGYACIPLILTVLSMIAMAVLYRLSNQKIAEYQKDINQRKQEEQKI